MRSAGIKQALHAEATLARRSRAELRAGGAPPRAVQRALEEQGTTLPPAVRGVFERGFGHDFSRVRVHRGEGASAAAAATGSRAFKLAGPIARCEAPASRGSAAWEGVEVTTREQTIQRYWDDERAPELATPLVAELRGLIAELREAPVAVLQGRLRLAGPSRADEPVLGSVELVLELINRGSEPVRYEPFAGAPLELDAAGARGVRLRGFDADDRLLPRAHSPFDLRAGVAVAVEGPACSRPTAELAPGATHSYRLQSALRELAAHVPRRARIECLVGVSFDACGGGALGDGFLMPRPLLLELARIH